MIRTGAILNNRYEILEKIGSGGMAYVFKARDRKLNRLVAIKVLKEEYCKDKSFVAKFRMEAQAAAGLSHNNIVGVYDVSEENNVHFIVMELVDGITLKEYIRRKKSLGAKETIGIAVSIAQGMEAAHNRHIVHRDIKPQNIIISKDGRVKVTDFGIARAITDETTNLYGAAGSVHYISPEQARGGYCDERSDIYSLGVTMYEMVTGRVPFDGDTTVAVAIAHINEAMIPPSSLEASVPVALEQIIYKCTQKRPMQRYASCSELIRDLRHAIVAPNERFVQFSQQEETPANETMVMNQEQIRDIRTQTQKKNRDPRRTEAVAANRRRTQKEAAPVNQRKNAAALEKKKRDSRYSREAAQNPPVKKRSLEDPNLFDKALAVIAAVLGVVMLCMLVYVVGSLNGAFQNDSSVVPKTTMEDIKETAPQASTYEKVSGESVAEDKAEVPLLLGRTIEEGTKLLEEEGLSIVVARNYEYSEEYDIGLICRQQYDEGTVLDKDTSVKVYISLGSDKFEINSKLYLNGNVSILNYYLKSFSDINVEYINQYSDVYARDIVFRLDPSEGYIGKGDKLTVYVSLGPEYSEIPDLYGMEQEQAISALTNRGFSVGSISQVYSNNTTAGLVCGQSIAPYSSKKSGTAVDFSISLGPKTVSVPYVVGSMEQEAIAAVSAANLYYDPHYQESSDVPAGMIINQSPAAGGSVPEFSTVVLTISSGPPVIPLAPDVLTTVGQDQAVETLKALGLVPSLQYEASNDIAVGCVIWWQSASGSDTLHAGDTVILHISTGPAQTVPPATDPVQTPSAEIPPATVPPSAEVPPASDAQAISETAGQV